jgi:hypothetical protein
LSLFMDASGMGMRDANISLFLRHEGIGGFNWRTE